LITTPLLVPLALSLKEGGFLNGSLILYLTYLPSSFIEVY